MEVTESVFSEIGLLVTTYNAANSAQSYTEKLPRLRIKLSCCKYISINRNSGNNFSSYDTKVC